MRTVKYYNEEELKSLIIHAFKGKVVKEIKFVVTETDHKYQIEGQVEIQEDGEEIQVTLKR